MTLEIQQRQAGKWVPVEYGPGILNRPGEILAKLATGTHTVYGCSTPELAEKVKSVRIGTVEVVDMAELARRLEGSPLLEAPFAQEIGEIFPGAQFIKTELLHEGDHHGAGERRPDPARRCRHPENELRHFLQKGPQHGAAPAIPRGRAAGQVGELSQGSKAPGPGGARKELDNGEQGNFGWQPGERP